MILGVAGNFASGKDTVANYLQRKSFSHISLSNIIREELGRRSRAIDLEALTEVGNELRERYGAQILAQRALEGMGTSKHYVVTSIRHGAEVEMLRSREDFALIWVEAPIEMRYRRSVERGRSGDYPDFESFRKAEERQQQSGAPAGQQLRRVREMADYSIANDQDLETLYTRVRELLPRAFREFTPPRPSWDEYFMSIAEMAATRSNCLKRRTGAVIVRDRQIVSTGYNGTPKGITNCFEGGCPRCNDFEDSGKRLDECLCVHAEENAIVQAACNGTSVRGGILYATLCPCIYCAKSIVNAGIVSVVYRDEYVMDEVTRQLFKQAGIEIVPLKIVPAQHRRKQM